MSKQYLSIPDDLKQAFWRIALNGNPHWVRYKTSQGKARGANDRQSSLGRVTQSGHDSRREAGKPYWYTPPVVDEHRLGFGFWSRSDQGEKSTYRFVAYDIEPICQGGSKRVNASPSKAEAKETLTEAIRVYKIWKDLAKECSEILWVLLVESSQHHYHVWVLFERPLTKEEHDQFLARAYHRHGSLNHLDKTTARACQGLGDQFRAPWSWKNHRKSEALGSWLRDEERAIELGEHATVREVHQGPTKTKSLDWKDHFQNAVERFPINGPGERHHQQAKLVGSLIGQGFEKELVLQVGLAWLKHYQAKYETSLEDARLRLVECVQQTLDNPRFQPAKTDVNYHHLHRTIPLNMKQEQFLKSPVSQLLNNGWKCDPLLRCDPLLVQVEDHTVEDHTQTNEKIIPAETRRRTDLSNHIREQDESLCRSEHEKWFVEALILHVQQKIKESNFSSVKMTNQQIAEIVQSRHDLELGPEQFNRLKKKFVSFRVGQDSEKWHEASRYELLKEVSKGRPHVPSRYEITGLGPVLDLEIRKESENNQAGVESQSRI